MVKNLLALSCEVRYGNATWEMSGGNYDVFMLFTAPANTPSPIGLVWSMTSKWV